MTEIHVHFATPSARLQLLMLLNLHTSGLSFEASSSVLATHPLMSDLLSSLLLDNSSTLCAATLTLVVKLLPMFAIHSSEHLKKMLPSLLAILARIVCWRERPPNTPLNSDDSSSSPQIQSEHQPDSHQVLYPHPDLHWERLEMTFNATVSLAPSPRPYYTALYYLYPSNVLKFLRGPVRYLVSRDLPSPYTVGWDQAFNDESIRRKSEV